MKVYNLPLSEAPFDDFAAHYGEVTKIVVSPDGRHIFSSGSDGTVFIYSITEFADEKNVMKGIGAGDEEKGEDQMSMIVDSELADIVLVKKSHIGEYRKKQEQLRAEMEETNNKVEYRISDLRYKYDQ
jgi:WD40 repeat protein